MSARVDGHYATAAAERCQQLMNCRIRGKAVAIIETLGTAGDGSQFRASPASILFFPEPLDGDGSTAEA
jgi:hypothetical protein